MRCAPPARRRRRRAPRSSRRSRRRSAARRTRRFRLRATSTSASISGIETSKSSRIEACDAFISAPELRARRRRAARRRACEHARVLGDDVAGAAVERRRAARRASSVGSVGVAQLATPSRPRRVLAFGAPHAVLAAGVAMRHARVDHDQRGRRGQREALVRRASACRGTAPRLDPARLAAIWSMMPTGAPTNSGFGALRDPRDRHVVERQIEQLAQRAQQRDFERRARRQAGAERHVGLDSRVEPADRCRAGRERRGDAGDVVAPAARPRARRRADTRPRCSAADVARSRRAPDRSRRAPSARRVVCCGVAIGSTKPPL